MKHIAAYALLVLGGKSDPSAADVEKVLKEAGAKADSNQIDTLITGYSQIVNNIQNIDIDKRKCAADNEINLKYFKGSRD